MKILVFGTFDQLHPGHLFFLNEARKRGELHIVIARDSNVERIKGRSASESQKERKSAVEKAFPDAQVILGESEDFLVPVRNIHPDLIILGYDQRLPPGVQETDFSCPVERSSAMEPSKYKSSLRRRGLP
ncbi:adenylyltransferase/cytidyltransferase family protein [Candidatus Peregrinibacteria bacterium]|nr:adenylyltransferase/cytidyltransferase family protein [Candidatus Peregrinibacteria bacterium]